MDLEHQSLHSSLFQGCKQTGNGANLLGHRSASAGSAGGTFGLHPEGRDRESAGLYGSATESWARNGNEGLTKHGGG